MDNRPVSQLDSRHTTQEHIHSTCCPVRAFAASHASPSVSRSVFSAIQCEESDPLVFGAKLNSISRASSMLLDGRVAVAWA